MMGVCEEMGWVGKGVGGGGGDVGGRVGRGVGSSMGRWGVILKRRIWRWSRVSYGVGEVGI